MKHRQAKGNTSKRYIKQTCKPLFTPFFGGIASLDLRNVGKYNVLISNGVMDKFKK